MKKNIWKKQYTGCLLAIGSFALLACSESETVSSNANLSTDKITFDANIQKGWDASAATTAQHATSAAIQEAKESAPLRVQAHFSKPLYLHPVVQEGIHVWNEKNQPVTRGGVLLDDVEQERVAVTRGSKKTQLSDYYSFGVTAIYPSSSTDYTVLLDNQVATSGGGSKWYVADNSYAKWPMNDELVSFHAYAPHSSASASMLKSTADQTKVLTTIHYEASKSDITSQPDLIVATQTGSRSNSTANKDVALQFSHALTAVTFAMSSDLADVIGTGTNLEKVRLVGIPNKGDCQLIAKDGKHTAASQNWTNINGSETFEFDLSKQNVTTGQDLALTSGDQTLMMIPQTLPSGAKAEFIFKIGGNSQTLSVDLEKTNWVAGSSVIYKLSANAINTLSSTEVTYPKTWTDYSFPKSDFATNEALGLYVVDANNAIVAKNVKVTKQENGSWNIPSKILKLAKYKYFAYFPYSSTESTVVPSATKAEDFFANKISGWSPNANQSSDILSQDLQVSKGVVGSNASTLTFSMAHQMGLAVLNLTSKSIVETRKFKNNNYTYYYPNLSGRATTAPTSSDYTDSGSKSILASNNFDSTNKPYKTSTTNRYIQIVKLNTNYTYSASDQSNSPRSAWGSSTLGKTCTFKATSAGNVQSKSITTDAEFYYLARVYTYTGSIEASKTAFTAPVAGEYILECWGGGSHGFNDESRNLYGLNINGGYSLGLYSMKLNETIYCICGGGGYTNIKLVGGQGGFNGGGNGGKGSSFIGGSGGGGATHISKRLCLLKELFSDYSNNLLLVAGGAGGSSVNGQNNGYGGGTEGGATYTAGWAKTNVSSQLIKGGTQTSGYAFGIGQAGGSKTGGNAGAEGTGGGGGGFQGGFSYQGDGDGSCCSGSGGSGYVNSLLISNGITSQNITSPSGNTDGYILISWFLK